MHASDAILGPIWQREGGAYNQALPRLLTWLTPAQQVRAERLRQGRMLFEGRHAEYFVGEGRSRFTFAPLTAGEPVFYSPFNVLGLASQKTADLLFGEPPRFYADTAGLQRAVEGLATRSWLAGELLAAAVGASWAGLAYLEVRRVAGEAYLSAVEPDELFPVGLPGPDRQYPQYVRLATATVTAPGQRPTLALLETTYVAGAITRTLWALAWQPGRGGQRTQRLPLAAWPVRTAAGDPLPEREPTGLSRPSIVCIPNERDGSSDYDGLVELQDALSAKHTQIARVLAKHADPKLALPARLADARGNLVSTYDAFYCHTQDQIPQYITWNAELAHALEDRKFALHALCMAAEMSQVLLGLKDGAAPDAARTLRLEATNTLAKVQRKAASWQPALRLALALALEVEGWQVRPRAIGVEIRDGLPADELDRSQTIATLRAAGVMSRPRALQQQWLDAASVREELQAIAAEHRAAAPRLEFPGI